MAKRTPPRTAWKKGQSGNPEGSRGRKIMADALGLALTRKADEAAAKVCAGIDVDPSDIRYIHVIAGQLVKKAAEGDIAAVKEIFDRIDGKVPQAHDIKSEHTVTHESESLSRFAGWLTEASAKAANGHDEDVGAERSLLSDQVPPGTPRH